MAVLRERSGENPVSIALFIAHANLDGDDCGEGERELIQIQLDTALDLAERYTGRAFVEQEVSVEANSAIVHLPVLPFDYIISGSLDGDPVERSFLYYDGLSGCCACEGYRDLGPRDLAVTYAPKVSAEPAAKQAILQIATWLYENRGDVDALSGTSSSIMNSGASVLLDPLKNMSIL